MAAVTSPLQSLITQFQTKEAEARAANIKRREQVTSIFDEIIARYGPGGTYGKGAEALLERQKVRDVGATAQRDISRGLYGIRPYEQEWEAGVGAESRLRLEDIKMERLSAAQMGKAGFMERIEEPYPDYSALMQAATAQAGVGMMPRETAQRGPAAPRRPNPFMQPLGGGAVAEFQPAAETAATGRGAGYTPPDITMGAGYGPAFEGGYTGGVGAGAAGAQMTKGVDTSGWTEAEKRAWANYVPGVSGYNVAARKEQERKRTTQKPRTTTPSVALGYSPYGAGGF